MSWAIEIENLNFSYPDGHIALRDVSLCIQPGEKVALVGPNGAGKSTLILHLNGVLPDTAIKHRLAARGLVRVSGMLVEEKTLGRVRATVGMVFQNPDDQLFSPTVYDDVAYGLIYQGLARAEVDARVRSSLAAVRMDEYASRVSHHLSMGEKKRITIATVLSMLPEVLVLDEPTAGLDPRARRMIIRLLDELSQTMLVSTHDLAMVRELLPRTIILDEGRVVADGRTADLLKDKALLAEHGMEVPC